MTTNYYFNINTVNFTETPIKAITLTDRNYILLRIFKSMIVTSY